MYLTGKKKKTIGYETKAPKMETEVPGESKNQSVQQSYWSLNKTEFKVGRVTLIEDTI